MEAQMNGGASESMFGTADADSLSRLEFRSVRHSGILTKRSGTRGIWARNGGHSVGLRITSRRSGSAVIIGVSGEVDASNESNWAHLLRVIVATFPAPGSIVVDVCGLEFMGLCAFVVLTEEAKRCRQRGIRLGLVSRQPIVDRIISECGLRWLLPVHPTIERALHDAAVFSHREARD
jgi:anti-anti-sigma factor